MDRSSSRRNATSVEEAEARKAPPSPGPLYGRPIASGLRRDEVRERRDPVETLGGLGNSIGPVESPDDAEGETPDLSVDEWKRWRGNKLCVDVDNPALVADLSGSI